MDNYDGVAKTIINESKFPYSNFIYDVVGYDDVPGMLFIRIYAGNLAEFSDNQIHSIRDWLQGILDNLNNHPLIQTKWTYEVSKNDPQ
jgi:hypothetical protein